MAVPGALKEMMEATVGPAPSQDNGEFEGSFCSPQRCSVGGQRKGEGPTESPGRIRVPLWHLHSSCSGLGCAHWKCALGFVELGLDFLKKRDV